MTDIRIGGVVRETLGGTSNELRIGGVVREVLNTGGLTTRIHIAGMAREVLIEGSNVASGAGAGGAGAVTAHHISRRRIMQMVNDNPRLARKLGIRGKLQILE